MVVIIHHEINYYNDLFFKDVVLLADFTIRKSPSFLRDKLHPCQLEMDGKDACVYVSVMCFHFKIPTILLLNLMKTIFFTPISIFLIASIGMFDRYVHRQPPPMVPPVQRCSMNFFSCRYERKISPTLS